MNLTDNESIKALECCAESKQQGCLHCPISDKCLSGEINICACVLNLINRKQAVNELQAKQIVDLKIKVKEQKAEIESLMTMLERSQEKYEIAIDALIRAKTKDIKEFAERLIHEIVNRPLEIQSTSVEYLHGSAYRQNEIVDLVKEMVGENEDSN